MKRSSVLFAVLVCVVGIGVGLLLVTLFGSNRVSDVSVAHTAPSVVSTTLLSNTAPPEATAAPSLATSVGATIAPSLATSVGATVAPSLVASVGATTALPATASAVVSTPTAAATNTVVASTATLVRTATSSAATPAATRGSATIVATPADGSYTLYTVQSGDTLKSIARENDVTVEQILAINTIDNPDSLTIGTKLRIPRS